MGIQLTGEVYGSGDKAGIKGVVDLLARLEGVFKAHDLVTGGHCQIAAFANAQPHGLWHGRLVDIDPAILVAADQV